MALISPYNIAFSRLSVSGGLKKRAGDEWGLVGKKERSPALSFSLPDPALLPAHFFNRPHWPRAWNRLLITQQEVHFINKSEATKRLRDRKENSKWTNVTNHKSCVGCQPDFTQIFQQVVGQLIPIDFCNTSRFCCKLFLLEQTMTLPTQMHPDAACTEWNFKFASARFTSKIVFFLLWTKNHS